MKITASTSEEVKAAVGLFLYFCWEKKNNDPHIHIHYIYSKRLREDEEKKHNITSCRGVENTWMMARIHRINIGAKCQVYYSAFITVLLFILFLFFYFAYFYENKRRNRFAVHVFFFSYFTTNAAVTFWLQLQNEAFSLFFFFF